MMNEEFKMASGQAKGPLEFGLIKESIFLGVLLLVSIVRFVPLLPNMPGDGLDPSWVYGMNEAVAQGMSFGKDVIFTLGPYASVYTKTYHPATDNLMILGSLLLAISFTVAAYLNFRTASGILKLGILAVLGAAAYDRDGLFLFYPMLVGLQFFNLSRAFDSKRKVGIAEVSLNLSLLVPFGLLLLIKGSFLISSLIISALSFVLFSRRGVWGICALIVVIPLASLVVFWLLSGQEIVDLPYYLIGLFPIIGGYTEAMAISGDPIEYLLYMAAASALLFCIVNGVQASAYDKLVVFLMFLLILFLTFKAGFVRHDNHAVASATMILLAALLVRALFVTQASLSALLVCLVAWAYIDAEYTKTSTSSIKEDIKNTYASSLAGVILRIEDPEALTRMFNDRVAEINRRGAIPSLNGTVDIYSHDQSYLISSGNKWSPRPIFQSYSV